MKSIALSVFTSITLSLLLTVTTTAAPSAASEAPNSNTPKSSKPAEENPSGVIKGTVKAMLGHSFGYITPTEGQQFELDVSSLAQIKTSLDFGNKQKGEYSYIPVPGPFSLIDVDWGTMDGKPYWNSFRAVSKNDKYKHKVTLEVSRYSQGSNHQNVTVWIFIENNNRTTGVCEIHGLVTPQKIKND